MDLSVGKLITDIPKAAVIIIDCIPNMSPEEVRNRTQPLVKLIRSSQTHAKTPIILAEGTPTPGDWLNQTSMGVWEEDPRNAALRMEYQALLAGGEDPALLHYAQYSGLNRIICEIALDWCHCDSQCCWG
jgi:hypothetical protein